MTDPIPLPVGTTLRQHTIVWRIEKNVPGHLAQIACYEQDPLAACRRCDEACAHGEESNHESECLAAQWIASSFVGSADQLYAGPPTHVRSGWIRIWWDGGDWLWEYASDPGSVSAT